MQNYMRVAPLFETLDDLDNSTDTMKALLGCDWYLQHINGVQEVMVGYSDSGKDAGRIAAAWGLYEVQESLVKVAKVRQLAPPFSSAAQDLSLSRSSTLQCKFSWAVAILPAPQAGLLVMRASSSSAVSVYPLSVGLPRCLSLLRSSKHEDSPCDIKRWEVMVERPGRGAGVQRKADPVPWARGHGGARRRAHPPGHPVAAAQHHQRQHPCHRAGARAIHPVMCCCTCAVAFHKGACCVAPLRRQQIDDVAWLCFGMLCLVILICI